MSDYHILQKTSDGLKVRCAFHIPIPDTELARTGTTLRELRVLQGAARRNSQVPNVTDAELAAIRAGELMEFLFEIPITIGTPRAAIERRANAMFKWFAADAMTTLRQELEHYAIAGDETA